VEAAAAHAAAELEGHAVEELHHAFVGWIELRFIAILICKPIELREGNPVPDRVVYSLSYSRLLAAELRSEPPPALEFPRRAASSS